MSEREICPRCGGEEIAVLATSPVPGVWTVWTCGTCTYSWRSTEPARNSSRAAYPARFRITSAEIENALEVPPVPDGAPRPHQS